MVNPAERLAELDGILMDHLLEAGLLLELPGLLSRLRDPGFFAQVRVDPELGAPVWPGGLDLDPLVLYAQALGTGLPLPAEASGA